MSTVLGPLFDQPLHHKSWCNYGSLRGQRPECPRFDYRITAGFHDVDLVNGGEHQAVDTGNASKGYPVLSPVSGDMRYLHHFDGARGREWDLGGDWTLEIWHVQANALLDPLRPSRGTNRSSWSRVRRGQLVAFTGDSGISVGAHSHIALKRSGKPIDPEPYLYIDDKPGQEIEGADDDMATFSDVPEGHPFYGDIEWMAEEGLTAGIPNKDGTFRYEPDRPVTRAELAAFLHRYDQLDI